MRTSGLGFLVSVCIVCVGCASKDTQISGQVTFEGKPVEQGTIEFIPIEGTGGPSTGASIKSGQYECSKTTGLVENGHYQVRITALAKTGEKLPNILESTGPPLEPSRNYIPAAYNINSALKVILSSRMNTFDFHLEGENGK